ncbi:MAG: N6-L-threonylcarbamoyladenine synthase [bacterium]|jgi:N6-L-threonylcarbamoyladenine synthase
MILGIETSCDDSAVALIDRNGKLLFSKISSQIELHEKYGGVVPELASRSHLTTLPVLIRDLLETEKIQLSDLDAVAVTYSPGLIGSLLVGVSYAKSLAWVANKPLIPVDHLEGHLLAPFLDNPELTFPYLALIASGGHTHLVIAEELGKYTLLGKTIDDAAGEAFDKVAKMVGFKYPGGPIVDHIAKNYSNPTFELPIPLRGRKTLNFSYSGLKTAVKNIAKANGIYAEKQQLMSLKDFEALPESSQKDDIKNLIASFQRTMTKTITQRFEQALKITGLNKIAITGGVAANSHIQASLKLLAKKKKVQLYYPELKHCTDNASMIAYTGLQYWKTGNIKQDANLGLNASPRSPLNQLELTDVFQ